MVANNKGLLAIDEGTSTCNKRFAKLGIPETEKAGRTYRELLIITPDLSESVSSVILYDETIRQKTKAGIPFVEELLESGIIPGIKVDTGAKNRSRQHFALRHAGQIWKIYRKSGPARVVIPHKFGKLRVRKFGFVLKKKNYYVSNKG